MTAVNPTDFHQLPVTLEVPDPAAADAFYATAFG